LFTNCTEPKEVTVSVDKEGYSLEEQKQVGDNFVANVQSTGSYDILDRSENLEFYSYVEQLWASAINNQMIESRLAFDWELFIVQNDEVKTLFSVPGGKIFIFTGFLKSINNESELFGIMAHELYYIDKGVVLEAMINNYGTLTVGDLWLNSNTSGVKSLVESIFLLRMPGFEVIEADKFAVDLVCPYRYDPKGLMSFLEMVYSSNAEMDWLITRPGTEERIAKFDTMGDDCGTEQFTFTERYAEYKGLLP
jgi:predicted Zn-dependent protease